MQWEHTKLVGTKTTPCGQRGKGKQAHLRKSAKCATVPIKHLCQVKALITSACLKHSDVTKLDNWIETLLHDRTRSTLGIDQLMSNCRCEVSLMTTKEKCEVNRRRRRKIKLKIKKKKMKKKNEKKKGKEKGRRRNKNKNRKKRKKKTRK